MDLLLKMNDQGLADFELDFLDIVGDETLYTAVVVSLFTDKRAEADELPIEYTLGNIIDLRGFFGDTLYNESIGSKLWLLKREKQLQKVLVLAKQYATEALEWLIKDGYVSAIDVVATNPQMGWLELSVTLTLPDEQSVFIKNFINKNWNFYLQLEA